MSFKKCNVEQGSIKEKSLVSLKETRLLFLARPERFERPTLWFVAKYSIQLSYGRQGLLLCNKNSIIT
jgi:hypothetical protein